MKNHSPLLFKSLTILILERSNPKPSIPRSGSVAIDDTDRDVYLPGVKSSQQDEDSSAHTFLVSHQGLQRG